ncbi:hypothetical protein TRAPUB_5039 [Trametes pubescens]|uniref:Aminoglycoside phosphotransferase domain-containing protein n=1 Tax=Trametes pubescens TaxID=154538 RepID=A0A1M2V9L5_TRAPU|nr:hypothetical protein TRAPUB_5039 [Trametes pubescens]
MAGTSQQLDEAQQTLLGAVEAATAMKIVKMDVLVRNETLVVKVEYENGQCDVVRSPCLYDENGKPQAHFLERFWLEVGLLQWFKNQALPLVPELRCAIEGPHPGTYPYAVIEMLPGTMLMNAFGRLPYSAKVYDTLEDFIDFFFQRKLQSDSIGTDEELRRRNEKVLARLASEVARILKRLASQAYRRCVLTHDDLHPTNILVSDSGALTGVIDWEYQSVLPAVLAVTYPPFLQNGLYDDDTNVFWSVSPEDAAELRKLFAHTVKSLDRECWDALIDGGVLRQAVEWLKMLQRDEGCEDIERWMNLTFSHHV